MSLPCILIVDDEPHIRRLLQLSLGDAGYRVWEAEDVPGALAVIASQRVDLVLTDLQLPGEDGLALLRTVHAERPDLPVILLTAYGTVESAVQALRGGAFDYVVKPFRIEEIEALVQRALGLGRAEREVAYLREVAAATFEGMVAESPAMRAVVETISRIADSPTTVLVTGETGTGKELVARALHNRSTRAGRLFVAVNCAAIPSELLEAELFGVTRGAFTGATESRPGKFELADGGTLFLDEIGDMPLAMQAKLLRALQEGAVERLGSHTVRRVEVRVVAATHRDLTAMVAAGEFRADLFYRLNVFPIYLPPLRERPEDLLPLASRAAERFAKRSGQTIRLAAAVGDELRGYAWPGNVRELENVIERAVLLARDGVVHSLGVGGASPPGAGTAPAPGTVPETLRAAVDRAERDAILNALARTQGNKAHAARLLGISVRTLWYKLERLSVDAPL